MSLQYKILLGFLFSALLVAVVGYLSLTLNRNIRTRLVQHNTQSIYLMEYTGEMAVSLQKSLMYAREYLDEKRRMAKDSDLSDSKLRNLRYSAENARESVRAQIKHFEKNLKKSISIARNMEGQADTIHVAGPDTIYANSMVSRLKRFRSKFDIYKSLLLELFKFNKQQYSDAQELFSVTLEPFYRTNLMPLIDATRDRAHRRVDRQTMRLEAELNYAGQIMLFVSILAVITALGMGYTIYRQISDPLNKLTASARRIGQRNLDERIDIDSNDEIGTLAETFNQMAENLDKTTVSRDYFNNIIESLSDGLIVVSQSFEIQTINQSGVELSGYTRQELEDEQLFTLFGAEQQDAIEEYLKQLTEESADYIETELETRNGEEVPVSFAASLLGGEKEQNGYVCLVRNIRQRKERERQIEESLEEKKVLLAEIHHRVKNNLAVISSLLQLQFEKAENPTVRSMLQDSVLRIQSIALIHEKLYQSETLAFIDYDKYLKDLIGTIEDSFADSAKDIDIRMDFAGVSLNVNQAIPCSLFVNEVLANSYKHAFPDRDEGRIFIQMNNSDGTIHLRIRDDGVGLPDDFNPDEARSLGMTLIHTLTKQLSGDLEIYEEQGTVYELQFEVE